MRFWRLLYSRTPQIRDAAGRVRPGSVASLERVRLGGIEQTVLLRGHDASRPVLLFLHGGPGGSAMPIVHEFCERLEERFVFAHWDQRGAGKSWSPDIPRQSMTEAQPVEDCAELARWPHYPPQTSSADLKSGLDVTKVSITSSRETVTALASPVALGQPGLSFRYVQTFGETEVPYLADTAHLNYPYGLGTDCNNVWIAEMWGNRALKYTNSGSFQQQIGIAGLVDDWKLPTGLQDIVDVSVDGSGNIWVVDDAFSHVAKLDSTGNLLSELGVPWESGTDNDHFIYPMSMWMHPDGCLSRRHWPSTEACRACSRVCCVFRRSGTARFGIVTAEFGSVTEHFGDVTDGRLVPA